MVTECIIPRGSGCDDSGETVLNLQSPLLDDTLGVVARREKDAACC
jgi:hypothetical protein